MNVNENDIVNVKVGDPVKISIDAYPDRKFNGVVREIAASAANAGGHGQRHRRAASGTVSDEVTNFIVKIRVADKDVALRPGMSATADIETQTRQERRGGSDPERHRAGRGRTDGRQARGAEGQGGA